MECDYSIQLSWDSSRAAAASAFSEVRSYSVQTPVIRFVDGHVKRKRRRRTVIASPANLSHSDGDDDTSSVAISSPSTFSSPSSPCDLANLLNPMAALEAVNQNDTSSNSNMEIKPAQLYPYPFLDFPSRYLKVISKLTANLIFPFAAENNRPNPVIDDLLPYASSSPHLMSAFLAAGATHYANLMNDPQSRVASKEYSAESLRHLQLVLAAPSQNGAPNETILATILLHCTYLLMSGSLTTVEWDIHFEAAKRYLRARPYGKKSTLEKKLIKWAGALLFFRLVVGDMEPLACQSSTLDIRIQVDPSDRIAIDGDVGYNLHLLNLTQDVKALASEIGDNEPTLAQVEAAHDLEAAVKSCMASTSLNPRLLANNRMYCTVVLSLIHSQLYRSPIWNETVLALSEDILGYASKIPVDKPMSILCQMPLLVSKQASSRPDAQFIYADRFETLRTMGVWMFEEIYK